MPNFTTGPTNLPDVGELRYNGCLFGPLFETKVSCTPVQDNAKRTIKLCEYTISVDGYVTLPAGAINIGATMATLYRLLTAQGGSLVYKGKALDIIVTPSKELEWGPVPEMLEFQPLGAGGSAKISWKVVVRTTPPAFDNIGGSKQIMQLNYDASVTYDEAGYSGLSVKGTMQIPSSSIGRNGRNLLGTVDNCRAFLDSRIMKGIDLGRFRITNRNFNFSRDKMTMDWEVTAEEKPYMDLPPSCTLAHGSYNVRPVQVTKGGGGLGNWLCTLKATYTVAGGYPRIRAWYAFLLLMYLRMQQSKIVPKDGIPPKKGPYQEFLEEVLVKIPKDTLSSKPWIIDFSIDEGMYLDSRTISFSTSWRLLCAFKYINIGSGLWRKLPEAKQNKGSRDQKNNFWARSMTQNALLGNIMGSQSWLPNQIDPSLDVIIDMGSTSV